MSRRNKRRAFVLLAMILIAGVAALSFRAVRSIQQQRLITSARSQGLEAYARGDLDAALHQLSYYFEHRKNDLEVNLAFADARSRKPLPHGKHLVEAVELYTTHGLSLLSDKAADDQQEQVRILNRLLDLYSQLGLRAEITRTANRLLQHEPDHIEALAAKGEVLALDRQFDEAASITNRLIQLDPDNLRWRRLALEIETGRGRRPDELIEQCRNWAEGYQADGRFHLLTASMLLEVDRSDEAKQEMLAAASMGARSPEVLERTALVLDLLGLNEQADEVIVRAIDEFPQQSWVREVKVRRHWHQHRLEEAFAEIENVRKQFQDLTPTLQRLNVLCLIADGDVDRAREALEPLLQRARRDQNEGDITWSKAVASALDASPANWRPRIESLGIALSLSPEDPVLHMLMGDACADVGEYGRALNAYSQAYELDPDWMAAGVAQARTLLNAGRLEEAFHISQVVVSRSAPDRISPILVLAQACFELRESGSGDSFGQELVPDLLESLSSVYEQMPENAEVATLLARGHLVNGDRESALHVIDDAISRSLSTPALLALAELSFEHKLGKEQQLISIASAQGEQSFDAALLEAHVQASSEGAEQGLQMIDRAIASLPAQDTALIDANCARLSFMFLYKLPGALEQLRDFVERYPNSPQVQQFALGQGEAWQEVPLVAKAMTNLKSIVGENAPQVRLAEANFLIRQRSGDQAMLARAIGQISAVLKETPDSLAGLSLMAQACMLGSPPNISEAVASLERAASLYTNEPSLLVQLISLLQRAGEYETAGRHLRQLAQLSEGQPQFQKVELRLLAAQNDFETAMARASTLVNDASPPPDQLILATIYHRAGKREEAQRVYERLLAEPHPDALVTTQAAEFFATIGEFQRGLSLLQQLDLPEGEAARSVLIGTFHQRHGQVELAGQWLRKAVEQDPKSVSARNELARHFLARNDRQRAREQAIEGLQIDPHDSRLRATLAIANLDQPGPERQQALALLRETAGENDDLRATLELLEQVPYDQGKLVPTDRNLAAVQRLVANQGGFMPAWLLAIRMHVDAGREQDAIVLARRAVSRFPAEVEPAQWSTQLLILGNRWAEALAEASEWRRRAIAQGGESLTVDVTVASILLELGRPKDALSLLEANKQRLINESQAHPDRLAIYLRALAESNQLELAMQIAQPLLDDQQWQQAWLSIAANLTGESARRALELLTSRNLGAQERLVLCAQYTELGKRSGESIDFDRAMEQAKKAGDEAEFAMAALLAQGVIAEARNDWATAEQLYRDLLARDSGNSGALNNLASVLARDPARCSEALPLIDQALRISPQQPDYLDTYGLVMLGLNRLPEAQTALAQALAARPEDVNINLNLIEVLLLQDRTDEAQLEMDSVEQKIRTSPLANPASQQRLDSLREKLQTRKTPISAASAA